MCVYVYILNKFLSQILESSLKTEMVIILL